MTKKPFINKDSNPTSYTLVIDQRRIESLKEAVEFVKNNSTFCEITHLKPLEYKGNKAYEIHLTTSIKGLFELGLMTGTYEERKRLTEN